MSCKQVNLNCANNFNVNSGSFYTFNVNLKRSLSGRTIHFDIKSVNDSNYLFELVSVNDQTTTGLYIQNEASGSFDVNISSADSAGINGNKVFECYYMEGVEKYILFQGNIEFTTGVI